MSAAEDFERMRPVVRELAGIMAEHTDCAEAPLCPSRQGEAIIVGIMAGQVGGTVPLTLTAIRMLINAEAELRAQHGLTADAGRALEMAAERADAAEASRQAMIARNEDLQRKLATVEAELTAWEEAADVIGPVGLPD